MLTEFRGKVAVVTGAASGIGKALCERFAREGMRVAVRDADVLVFSCLQGKDLAGMSRVLASCRATRGALVLVPELPGARARPSGEVVAALSRDGFAARAAADVATALRAARNGASRDGALVVAFGSFVIAGSVLRALGSTSTES